MTIDEFNPDGMTQSELWDFWTEYHRCSRKKALAFLNLETEGRKGAARIVQTLANYACNKAVAMGCRERGEIDSAWCYEQHAELSYNRLPEDVRW